MLLAFFPRRTDNAGDVGLSLLFVFYEGNFVVGARNLHRVVAEIDQLFVLLDCGLGTGFERGSF